MRDFNGFYGAFRNVDSRVHVCQAATHTEETKCKEPPESDTEMKQADLDLGLGAVYI